jgi:hypothetical protein
MLNLVTIGLLRVNYLKPTGCYLYNQVEYSKILHSAQSAFMCSVRISEQRNSDCFPYVALIGWYFTTWKESVYCAVRAETLTRNQLKFSSLNS